MTFAQVFTRITVAKAEELISTEKQAIIFVGRSSCPYCQRFEPKLTNVAKVTGKTIYFINSEDFSEMDVIQIFRHKHRIPTVPGLLVTNKGDIKVVCDSSLSEEEITAFIA